MSPLAAAERRDSSITPTHSGLLRLDYATQTARDVSSSSTHSGLECDATEQHDVKCVVGGGHHSCCDGVGEGGKQSSKSIQECFRFGYKSMNTSVISEDRLTQSQSSISFRLMVIDRTD